MKRCQQQEATDLYAKYLIVGLSFYKSKYYMMAWEMKQQP